MTPTSFYCYRKNQIRLFWKISAQKGSKLLDGLQKAHARKRVNK